MEIQFWNIEKILVQTFVLFFVFTGKTTKVRILHEMKVKGFCFLKINIRMRSIPIFFNFCEISSVVYEVSKHFRILVFFMQELPFF